MKLKMYTIYDEKIGAYLPPIFLQNAGHATRSFEAAANDPNSTIAKYPADMTMFEIGEYDDNDSQFVIYEAKKSIGNALEFIKPKQGPLDPAQLEN